MTESHGNGTTPQFTNALSIPDTNVLIEHGWQIVSSNGAYCLVWRLQQEVLMVWRDGGWYQLFEVSREARGAA